MKKYPLLQRAYHFTEFKESGKQLIDQLTEYLCKQQLADTKANNWQTPDKELDFWENYQFSDLNNFVADLFDHSIHLHNPKYMGHQVSVPAPLSVLTNLISGLLNNGMAVYEMGKAATAIEKCVVDLFCEKIGYDNKANGILTSGGTLANLTALLAARQALHDSDIWQDGCREKLAVLVSSQAHYSIDRAARVMGLGNGGVVLVPVDTGFAMDQQALETCYSKTTQAGLKVIAIVGSACSTATGVYDNLQFIGDFCRRNSVWFHVDGAHGGAAVFSDKYKRLLKGIEMADSVIIDTHKMMMTPALSTVVLFKDKKQGSQTFHQKAQYLFEDANLDEQWFNSGLRTFECTKLMMCLKFYVLWKTYGIKVFEENIDCLYGLGKTFAEMVSQHSSFELALKPQTNIVCFRYIKQEMSEQQINELNKSIRQSLLEDSEFYIVQAVLNDMIYLRVTLMNPLTNEIHLQQLLEKIISVV
ncbi:MAG: aminotransferase class I/II-fold pyridoxal phosphate-dependent enzyme [Alcanivoracaceae bacterium]|nr:aminotransferase class I/II-fold pyridoxal phosphate-dependent enzyme [Alcanivoracaceae bacterium]